MPRGKKKAPKEEEIREEEIEEETKPAKKEKSEKKKSLKKEESEEELEEEMEESEEERDTSIEEEIIEIEEKKEEPGKKLKEIPKMEEEIEEVLEERIYIVPLGRVKIAHPKRRAKRAVTMLRAFVIRHMKPESIFIDPELNELIWSRGIEKPPRRLRIRATKDREGLVKVYSAEG
jgi:large subunit ribosomal protein L31e